MERDKRAEGFVKRTKRKGENKRQKGAEEKDTAEIQKTGEPKEIQE